jgi:hypothetical protein
MASAAASHVRTANGVLGGPTGMNSGGKEESVVVSLAVQDAPAELEAPAGVQVAAAPRFDPPTRNCTVPEGPSTELLLELTVAVKVRLPPDVMLLVLGTVAVDVTAGVIVMVSVAEVLPLKLLSPAYVATTLCVPADNWMG